MDPGLYELLRSGHRNDEVAVMMRLDRDAVPEGARIICRFGAIATARVRRGAIPSTRVEEGVRSLKAPRLYSPDWIAGPVETADSLDIYPTDRRRPRDLPQTGRGVVIGLVDWGFDFGHPDFRNPDGSTRLLALWDQRGRAGDVSNNHYGYGWVHDRAAVNRALATRDPYRELAYHPADAGRGPSHGTHTAGIATGNGRAGGPAGMAPQADIVFVHLATATGERGNHLGDSAALLEAVDFISRIAGARPWVLSLSMGRHAGPHDGCTLIEQGLDAAVAAAPGRACVQSTGNYYGRPIHARGVLRPGEIREIRFHTVHGNEFTHEIEVWYSGRDRLQVEILSPDGTSAGRALTGEQTLLTIGEKTVGRLYNRERDPNNHDNVAHLYLDAGAPQGRWTLRLEGSDVVDGRYHCWVERDPSCAKCQPGFDAADVVRTSTTGTICNGFLTIAVGAYDPHDANRSLAKFSSSGLTRDQRFKPDLVAPGVDILSARSAPRGPRSDAPLLTRMSGTSMAAPYVAGTVALMFEAALRKLTVRKTRDLLLSTAEPLSEGAPQERWGSGYVNVREAVAAAAANKFSEPSEAARWKGESGRRTRALPLARQS